MTDANLKDEILKLLAETSHPTRVETISAITNALKINKEKAEHLCKLIKHDDYIIYTQGPDGACKIRPQGIEFLKKGGYSHQENMEILRTQKAETKEELELEQIRSVIATSIETQNSYAEQRKLGRRSLLLGAFSVIFIVISTILQLCSNTDKELQGIKEQLQKSSQSLDSIRLSLEMINASTKNLRERSDTSHH